MHPKQRIVSEIKRMAGGEISPASIERAVGVIERSTPIGAVMASVAPRTFTSALIEAAEERSPEEELAWLTLVAAGPVKSRLALAERAVEILDVEDLVVVAVEHRDRMPEACERYADAAADDEQQGAWMLLSRLYPRELRELIEACPDLCRRYRKARREYFRARALAARPARRRGPRKRRAPINPQIAAQLQGLGLLQSAQ